MGDDTTKRCSKCSNDLPLNAFGKNSHETDGLQRWCKACRHEHAQDPTRRQRKVEYDQYYRAGNLDDWKAQQPRPDLTVKHCAKCGETKPRDEFGANKGSSSGLQTYCKVCSREIDRARNATPERQAAQAQAKRERYAPTKAANETERTQTKTELRSALDKTCKRCGNTKPIESYTVDERYADGRYPWCAGCRKAWREGRKERTRELNK